MLQQVGIATGTRHGVSEMRGELAGVQCLSSHCWGLLLNHFNYDSLHRHGRLTGCTTALCIKEPTVHGHQTATVQAGSSGGFVRRSPQPQPAGRTLDLKTSHPQLAAYNTAAAAVLLPQTVLCRCTPAAYATSIQLQHDVKLWPDCCRHTPANTKYCC
jgi:hypothetical protein